VTLTTKTRLALWFAAALGAILAAFSVGVYVAVDRALLEALDARLRARIEAVERDVWVDERGRAHLSGHASEEEVASPLTEVVRLPEGEVIYRSEDHEDTDTLARTGAVRRDIMDWKSPRTAFLASGHEVRLMAVRASAGGRVYEVWMAESLDPVRAERAELAAVLGVLFPLAIGLAIVGGRWLAGRAIRPIEEALAAMRRFTADASHEFRTPLAAIRTEFEVTLRRDRAPEEYRQSMRIALGQVDGLATLASRLLDLSRADAPGGLPLERKEVAVDALARELCEGWAAVAAERGIDLRCEAAAAAVVSGDRHRLRELLENLLDNALKHTDAGGRVVVRVGLEPRAVLVEVADTGHGIEPAHLPHVFERFYRADAARPRGGAGLGLAIAKAVAEAHGGSIGVASEPRKGSVFSVRLPRA
jgi:signal transduction histidine kinase